MPAVMSMFYGMEVMQNKDKITFFSELNDAMRRVYLDGRKPSQKVLDDPTYAGYSTGHWEGDTLVVETVAIRGDTFIEGITPHSDADDRARTHPAGGTDAAGRSDYRQRSQGADQAVGDREDLSEGDACVRDRRAAGVRMPGGAGRS